MKIPLILTLLLSFSALAQNNTGKTTLELIMNNLSKRHGGDEVMEVLNGGADFIGYDLGAAERRVMMKTIMNIGNLEDFVMNDLETMQFKKDKHYSEAKVRRVVKKLKKECAQYLKEFNQNNQYYCSDIFVYSGDVSDPELEGRNHKARGQTEFYFMDHQEGQGKLSPSETRLSLASNNEKMANYDVYTIGIMKR